MPRDAEIADFAKQLPPIYQSVLSAFPAVEPGRKAGYGLAPQTLAMHFVNKSIRYGLGEVQEACKELAKGGFFEVRNGMFYHPTEIGEQLIAAVTGGAPASKASVPPLPARSW